jgi:hypothetical protein
MKIMYSHLRRKARAIALGGILIVTQCCCCILPIRWQVDRGVPGVNASVLNSGVERALCELKSVAAAGAAQVLPAAWLEAQQGERGCESGNAAILKKRK